MPMIIVYQVVWTGCVSQCLVLNKYLPGAVVAWRGGAGSSLWPQGGVEGAMLKSLPATDVISGPVTYTPDPFTI